MKLKIAKKPFKLVLITETRDEICLLSNRLFEGMNPVLFGDRKHPVVITVRGAYGAGKTLFPDMMREALIPDAICTSKAIYKSDRLDESYTGFYQGKPFDFTFINSIYTNRFFYSHPAIQETSPRDDGRGIIFIGLRENGGITFIHNDDDAVMESSIDIWIEDGMNGIEGTREKSRLQEFSLKDLFVNQVKQSWRRYIEVSIYDHRLFEDENFMKKLGTCKGIVSLGRIFHDQPRRPPERKPTPSQTKRQNAALQDFLNSL